MMINLSLQILDASQNCSQGCSEYSCQATALRNYSNHLSVQMLDASPNCPQGRSEVLKSLVNQLLWGTILRPVLKHCSPSNAEMFQILSRTCLNSTLINKQVDYYICVCYHQNLTLHKNRFNTTQWVIHWGNHPYSN